MLSDNTINIWEVDINTQNFDIAKQYIEILSDLELEKMYKFKFIEDYSLYLVSHVAMRLLISKYSNIKAKEIIYQYGENGKPWVSEDLQFNLSHAHKKALIGFYRKDIGVDIEYKKEIEGYCGIGDLVFTEKEKEYMNAGNKKDRFYELWTRKEAIIKVIGVGLTDEVKDLSVGTKEQFYKGNQIWQIKKIKSDFDYIAHVAYKNDNVINNIKLYNFSFRWVRKLNS